MGLRSEILFTNEVGIFAVKFNKLLVSTAFYDFAIFNKKYSICELYRWKSMSNS